MKVLDNITSYRLNVFHNGYPPVPVTSPDMDVPHAGKNPWMKNWDTRCAEADADAIARYARNYPEHTNTGIMCGDVVAVDIDVPVVELAAAVKALAFEMLGSTSLERIGHAPKLLLVFRAVKPFEKMTTAALKMPDGTAVKVEILAHGQQFVANGIHPKTRAPFEWPGESPLTVPFAALPETSEADCRKFIAEAERLLRAAGAKSEKDDRPAHKTAARAGKPNGHDGDDRLQAEIDDELQRITDNANTGCNDAINVTSMRLAQRAAAGLITVQQVRDLVFARSVEVGYVARDGERAAWATIESGIKKGLSEPRPIEKRSRTKRKQAATVCKDQSEESKAAENSEIALAHILVARHGDHLRYVAAWNKWFIWRGGRWQEDTKMEISNLAREIVEEASQELAETQKQTQAKAIAGQKTVANVVALTRSYPKIAATVDQWDTDPLLLNMPDGAIDLRTGETRPHDPLDYCTKITAVAPAASVPDDCLWLRFLKRICGGDDDLVSFLRRAFGYSLTGSTNEEAFFFGHGLGQNGKTKLYEATSGAVGNYHEVAAMETFVASKYEQHPADLAKLHGARLVTAVETEDGRRWSEAKIKSITGGDQVSARFMRQDFFTFRPQLKLWVAGNHKPGLRNVDAAMRRRLNLIPFNVTIREAERDRDLSAKLRAEWPIVLRWMIDGCLEWQRDGLNPPAVVTAATDAYMQAEDVPTQWLNECCDVGRSLSDSTTFLWNSWKAWADLNGEFVGNKRKFANMLQDKGFTRTQTRAGIVYVGLASRGGAQ